LDSARARQIVDQTVASGRSGSLLMLKAFLRLLKRYDDSHSARVDSAVPLGVNARAAIEQWLVRRYGRPMTTTFAIDPTLIGGLRLKAGSDVYDDSVKSRLVTLECALRSGTT
jgi:F-type H+-transporting ATPase subunit delta